MILDLTTKKIDNTAYTYEINSNTKFFWRPLVNLNFKNIWSVSLLWIGLGHVCRPLSIVLNVRNVLAQTLIWWKFINCKNMDSIKCQRKQNETKNGYVFIFKHSKLCRSKDEDFRDAIFLTNLSFHRYKMFLIRIEKKAIEIQGWFSYGCPFHHNSLIATPILRK